ncbi:MAG: sensor histidine kinase [Nocardia sp.]|nr:sensor histidine kinase [Nocardia sp.]
MMLHTTALGISFRELMDRMVGGPSGGAYRRASRTFVGAMMALAWLFYLIGPVVSRWQHGRAVDGVIAAVGLVLFGVLIASCFGPLRQPDWEHPADAGVITAEWPRWAVLAAMAGLGAALTAVLGAQALGTLLYVPCAAVFILPTKKSGAVVAATVIGTLGVEAIPSLHLGNAPKFLIIIPIAMWVGRQLGMRQMELRELARRQRSELEIVEERNRVARDVHDILGHSLTVITVKTELAQRLLESDPAGAARELADLERLAREALAGVRDTVGGLREVSLAGELATARTALDAAAIHAELPDPARLPDRHSETFGWVVREAITNVVRHSRARRCWIRVDADRIEIRDDGTGLTGSGTCSGSGLTGLRERVRAAGGRLAVQTPGGGGLSIVAEFPRAAADQPHKRPGCAR